MWLNLTLLCPTRNIEMPDSVSDGDGESSSPAVPPVFLSPFIFPDISFELHNMHGDLGAKHHSNYLSLAVRDRALIQCRATTCWHDASRASVFALHAFVCLTDLCASSFHLTFRINFLMMMPPLRVTTNTIAVVVLITISAAAASGFVEESAKKQRRNFCVQTSQKWMRCVQDSSLQLAPIKAWLLLSSSSSPSLLLLLLLPPPLS